MSYRKIVYSLYAFMLCVAIGCTDKGDLQKYRPDMTGADYSVEIVPSDETLVLSDIVDGYRLMEPKGVLLANIGEVLPYDSLFILSGISAEGGYVHLFDAMGNYQKTLLKKGQGPGEAVELNSLKVYGDDLYFLVNVGMKMMHYSLKDGLFVGSFPLPEDIRAASDFERLDNDRYVFYKEHPALSEEEYKLYVYNKSQGRVEHRWIPMNKEACDGHLWFGQKNCLYRFKGKYRFHEVFQKGIYEIAGDSLRGYIAFKDNSYTMPDKVLFASYPSVVEFVQYCHGVSYVWSFRQVREGPRFVMADFWSGERYYWNVIDKSLHGSQAYARVKDDVLLETEVPVIEYMMQKNIQGRTRYFSLSYDFLRKVMEEKKESGELEAYARRHPDLMEIYNNMNEDSNEVIVMFYEKE